MERFGAIDMMTCGAGDDSRIDADWKGFPSVLAGCSRAEAAAMKLSLLNGDFLMPLAVLRSSAIERNIRSMNAFTDAARVQICPHGKTTMSPELFRLQLNANAWGMTAATAHHVRTYRRWGVPRIILANQLIAQADIALILDELARSHFEFYCLVDSEEGATRLAKAVRAKGMVEPINILLEIGSVMGRTGVRSVEAGIELARTISAQRDALALRGIEIYEGIHPIVGDGPIAAEKMTREMIDLARKLMSESFFAEGEIILTGGGSALFDICVHNLAEMTRFDGISIILRSGCYITHDHGIYAAAIEAMRLRNPGSLTGQLNPEAALEVWGMVQSVPDPGFAVIGMGKRDVGHDTDIPRPVWYYRPGDSRVSKAGDQLRITRLYDQHACLEGADDLKVGDLIGFGISHPCTTFDRWRAIPLVDDAYRMTDFITTAF